MEAANKLSHTLQFSAVRYTWWHSYTLACPRPSTVSQPHILNYIKMSWPLSWIQTVFHLGHYTWLRNRSFFWAMLHKYLAFNLQRKNALLNRFEQKMCSWSGSSTFIFSSQSVWPISFHCDNLRTISSRAKKTSVCKLISQSRFLMAFHKVVSQSCFTKSFLKIVSECCFTKSFHKVS